MGKRKDRVKNDKSLARPFRYLTYMNIMQVTKLLAEETRERLMYLSEFAVDPNLRELARRQLND